MAASSSSSSTRPVGLFGELMSRMRVAGVTAASSTSARQPPIVVRIERHRNRPSARQLDHRPVGDPGWLGDQHIDARFDEGQGRLEQRLLAARGDDDTAVRLDLDAVVVAQLVGDRLAQRRRSGAGDVVGFAGVHRLDRGVGGCARG